MVSAAWGYRDMDNKQIAALSARTDAVFSLLTALLIDKGIVSKLEMANLLDRASALITKDDTGAVVATVFVTLRGLLEGPLN
jgi:hypothetical protein